MKNILGVLYITVSVVISSCINKDKLFAGDHKKILIEQEQQFIDIAKYGNYDDIKFFIDDNEISGETIQSAITAALETRNTNLFQCLMDVDNKHFNAWVENENFIQQIIPAQVNSDNIEVVRWLANNYSKVFKVSNERRNMQLLFNRACYDFLSDNTILVECLKDVNFNFLRKDKFIHWAVKYGYYYVVKYLIEECKVDMNIKNFIGDTPLHEAVKCNNLRVIKYLIEECKVNVNIKNFVEDTPLHFAAKSGNFCIIQCLIENGADVNSMNINGETPIEFAIKNGNLEVIRYLVHKGAKYPL